MNETDHLPQLKAVMYQLQKSYQRELVTVGHHLTPESALKQVRHDLIRSADVPPTHLKLAWQPNGDAEQHLAYEDIHYYLTPAHLTLTLERHELYLLTQFITHCDEHPLLPLVLASAAGTLQQPISPPQRAEQLRHAAARLLQAAELIETHVPELQP